MSAPLHTENRPSSEMPSRYIQTGLLFLNGAVALILMHADALMAPPRHNPVTLVLTHMMVLGFGTLITFGALEQMIPVILGQKIASERHSPVAYAHLTLGIIIQLAGFALWKSWVIAVGGTLIVGGTIIFTLPYVRPLWQRARTDPTAPFILSSLLGLNLTVLLGVAMAIQLRTLWWPWLFWQGLPLHLLLGGLSWFTQIIVGVSYKLFPMFITTATLPEQKVRRVFLFLNIGTLVSLGSALFSWLPGALTGLLLIVIGLAQYALDVRTMLRKRLRRKLGAGMVQSAMALLYLIATLILTGCIITQLLRETSWLEPLAFQRLIVATGLLFAFGWVGSMILGMLSKIAPMLVWLDRYSSQAGQANTPLIGEMIDARGVAIGGAAYHTGVVTVAATTLWGEVGFATVAGTLLLFGAVYLTGTLYRVWAAA